MEKASLSGKKVGDKRTLHLRDTAVVSSLHLELDLLPHVLHKLSLESILLAAWGPGQPFIGVQPSPHTHGRN